MKTSRKQPNRRANALVELVVSLPILFLLTFGGIEACNLNHLQQCAVQVSYQGALRGVVSGSTEAEVKALMQALLDARNIEKATITVVGPGGAAFDSLAAGSKFKVTTVIPSADNLPLLSFICNINDLQSDRFAQRN